MISTIAALFPWPDLFRAKAFLAGLVLFLALPCFLYGAEAYVLPAPGQPEVAIGDGYQFYEDSTGEMGIEDILSPQVQEKFRPGDDISALHAFTSSARWIRFSVCNRSLKALDWFLELANPDLKFIDIYRVNEKNRVADTRHSGAAYSFTQREIDHRYFVFRMMDMPGRCSVIYVRVKSEGYINSPVVLWSPDGFLGRANLEYIMMGLYYGAVLVMLIYNLFIFFSVRDYSYLFYVLYYVSFFMFQFCNTGLASQYLWPASPWWAGKSLLLFIILSLIFSLNFCRVFLRMDEQLPRMNGILIIIMLFQMVFVPFSFLLNYTSMLVGGMAMSFITALLVTVALVRTLRKGFVAARFYAIAWGFFWVTVLMYILRSLAVLPDSFATKWGMQFASFFEMVLMSLALADRINHLNRRIATYSENVEDMVEERTGEINSILNRMEKRDNEMQKELDLAANIQKGILPQMPWSNEGINIEAFTMSMGKVGGDFYDVFRMQGGHIGVLVADVSGHGMPAAFITALAKISFSEVMRTQLFPRDIFINVNNELMNTIKTDDFVTAFLMVISPSYEVFYGNASHMHPVVVRRKNLKIEEWDTNGLFMGAMAVANEMYEDRRDNLDYGDRVLIYTDGISEARNVDGEKYGLDRLKELLVDTMDLPLQEVREMLVEHWSLFVEGTAPADDATFILLEIDSSYRDLVQYREKGFKLLSRGEYDSAINELNRALEIDISDEKTHLYIGECYLNNKDYTKAVTHLQEYLFKNEIDANVWCHLAEAYYNMRDYPLAHRAAKKALQFRNRFTRALTVSGLSLKYLHQKKEAYQVWKRLLSIEPENETARREIEEIRNGLK